MPRIRMESQPGGMRLATGTYTGDGNATQAIVGVGFQPRFVVILGQQDSIIEGYGQKADVDVADWAKFSVCNPRRFYYLQDYIISLDADGFTVGDSTTGIHGIIFNALGVNYSYIAFR